MATLATVLNRFLDKSIERDETARVGDNATRLRAFANEDVYFFVKHIDNTSLVRQADPAARETCWKLMGSVVLAAILLIIVLLPSAYGLMAGFQIQSLKQKGQLLLNERASLELQEAAVISPERMRQLAQEQQFIDPPAAKIFYLDGSQVAQNKSQSAEPAAK